jgi:predicted MFS family arabinose efflux permease
MMAVFYFGCGASLLAAALAPNLTYLAVALFVLGIFAAIYHPVATAMVVALARHRGRTLALNGVCGNFGVALAAGITAAVTALIGWRGAFLLPAAICIATGVAYLMLVPDDSKQASGRSSVPDVRLAAWLAATVFGLFILIAVTAGLVFNTVTIALPKIIDERLGFDISLTAVGGIATAVFLCGAIAQFTIGRLLDKYPPHLVFATVATLQFVGVVWVAYAAGSVLLVALAVAMSAIYAQVTVTDFVLARYTADAWRARIYSVRYFVTYVISGAAAWMIASLYGRGGFDLVLGVTAVVALGFVIGTVLIAVLVRGVERDRSAVQPAE